MLNFFHRHTNFLKTKVSDIHKYLIKVLNVWVKDVQKKSYGPLLWMGYNRLDKLVTCPQQFLVLIWSIFERLNWPWNHPVVLNSEPLDEESSALTTRPLLYRITNQARYKMNVCVLFFSIPNLISLIPYQDIIFSNNMV